MFIGLMGVQNDGRTLVSPGGRRLFAVPTWLARRIQAAQHWVARRTWR